MAVGDLPPGTRKRVHVALGWLAETEGDARAALDHHRLALTSGSGQRNLTLAALAAEGLCAARKRTRFCAELTEPFISLSHRCRFLGIPAMPHCCWLL